MTYDASCPSIACLLPKMWKANESVYVAGNNRASCRLIELGCCLPSIQHEPREHETRLDKGKIILALISRLTGVTAMEANWVKFSNKIYWSKVAHTSRRGLWGIDRARMFSGLENENKNKSKNDEY